MSNSEAPRIVTPLFRGEEDGVSEAVEPTRTAIVMQQSAKAQDEGVIDSHPAFSAWWERWRKARARFSLVASIRRHP
jgi:hypothetical protein